MTRLILVALAILISVPCGPWADAFTGEWEGTLSFREDTTAVELEVRTAGQGLRTLLSLPELVMFREPAPARIEGERLIVVLPFGIGEMALAPTSDASGTRSDLSRRLDGSRTLGKEEMTLTLEERDGAGLIRREVAFQSGGVELSGTLVMPHGPGPHPAVALVHGSATISRAHWGYRSWAENLARRGIAALAYDRRPDSTASGHPPDFPALADDAVAAVGLLRSAPGINPGAVGLMGGSQAGWVAPLAATRSDKVAFLVLGAAAGVSPGDQEMQSAMARGRAASLSEEHLLDLKNYLRLYFYVARSGKGWALLQSEIAEAQVSPWGDFVDQPRSLEDLAWWKRNADFQPEAVLPQVGIPVLASWGKADTVVPPGPNAPLLEELLRSGGNPDITVQIFNGADHRMELAMGKDARGQWHWPRIAPGYPDSIEQWIKKRTSRP